MLQHFGRQSGLTVGFRDEVGMVPGPADASWTLKIIVMEDILIPLGVCVVMPVMIVWLVFRSRNHTVDRKMDVLIKAIENGQDIDPELLSDGKAKNSRTLKMELMGKLQSGVTLLLSGMAVFVACFVPGMQLDEDGIFIFITGGGVMMAIGVAMILMFFIGKKWMASEIEAEERKLSCTDADRRNGDAASED